MPANPPGSDFSAHFPALSQWLACPACHGELRLDAMHVACSACGKSYPIVDGIPVLIPNVNPKS